ncbi:Coiled-coil domain-containing protein 12 [Gonapodya sp. JEL0774]|nr:Coiled-coil domain-containing protein 12 [Gonapodya sp. JEL0774]
MSAPINVLEEEALKRKDRLVAFRADKLGLPLPPSNVRLPTGTSGAATTNKRDRTPGSAFVIGGSRHLKTLEEEVALFAKEALDQEEQRKKEVYLANVEEHTWQDIFNLAPRKANWDLKRDLQKKLVRLERKTQSSIAEIIRQRISTAGSTEDIGAADVDMPARGGSRATAVDDFSDED